MYTLHHFFPWQWWQYFQTLRCCEGWQKQPLLAWKCLWNEAYHFSEIYDDKNPTKRHQHCSKILVACHQLLLYWLLLLLLMRHQKSYFSVRPGTLGILHKFDLSWYCWLNRHYSTYKNTKRLSLLRFVK